MANLMGHQVGAQICNALGLPNYTVGFTMRCRVGEVVTIECEYYPDANGAPALVRELGTYTLVKADGANTHDHGDIDFDAWLRDRADRAHAAFMRRTSRLP